MENERNISRGEPQPVAQVDSQPSRGAEGLQLPNALPRSANLDGSPDAGSGGRAVCAASGAYDGGATGHGRAASFRRQHSHGEGATLADGGHAADGGEAWASA
eukprot:220970-Pleurochrysis_carterae.AAC.1